MGISRVLGFCAALLFASSVSAAQIIDLGPSDWRRWGSGTSHHHTNGLNTKFGQTVRMPPMNTSLTVTRNAVIPYGSIANGLRQFTRINPASVAASAAVTGLFLAVDWVFDEASGQWSTTGYDPVPDSGMYWYVSHLGTGQQFASPLDACHAFIDQRVTNYQASNVRIEMEPGTEVSCYATQYYYGSGSTYHDRFVTYVRRSGNCPSPYVIDPATGACSELGLIPLTGSDWSRLEAHLPVASPVEVGSAAGDAMQRQGAPLNGYSDITIEGPSSFTGPETTSTSTDPVTGDTVVTTTNTTTNIQYGDTTITTSNTTTSTTYQNGQETGTTVTTETPGELPVDSGAPPLGEWPAFCDWATVVCDWLNWTQEEPPPDVDLPQVIDDDFFNEKTISFGAKSCPPDYEINLAPFLSSSVGVSFQPLCDFAGLIYYMVMAASYIIAAYISIGVARNG